MNTPSAKFSTYPALVEVLSNIAAFFAFLGFAAYLYAA